MQIDCPEDLFEFIFELLSKIDMVKLENNFVFKGDYSDKVYYKSFFDIDERVIDITNVIILSSDKNYKINTEKSKKIEELNVDIKQYLNDFYKYGL